MSQGKYSPTVYSLIRQGKHVNFIHNSYGNIPPNYNPLSDSFDERLHFANYDKEGYDSYGYSAYDENRNYVGIGNGVDRLGYTENEYDAMTPEDFACIS